MEKTKYGGIFRRILAGLLALVMILGVVPMNGIKVEAAETEEEDNVETLLLDTEITVTEHLDFIFVPEETGYYVLQSIGENPIDEVDIHDTHEEYEFEENNKEVVSFYLEKGEEYDFDFFCYDEEDEYVFKMLYAGTESPEFKLSYDGLKWAKLGEVVELNIQIMSCETETLIEDVSDYKFIWHDMNDKVLAETQTFVLGKLTTENSSQTYVCEVSNGFFTEKAWIRVVEESELSLGEELTITKDIGYLYTPVESGYYVIQSTGEKEILEVAVNYVSGGNIADYWYVSTEDIYLEAGTSYRICFEAYSSISYTAKVVYAGKINPSFSIDDDKETDFVAGPGTKLDVKYGEDLELTPTIIDNGWPENGYSYTWYYEDKNYKSTLIENENNKTYTIQNITNNQEGTYKCVVSNGYYEKTTRFYVVVYKDLELAVGQTTVSVDAGEKVRINYTFTPEESGYYLFDIKESKEANVTVSGGYGKYYLEAGVEHTYTCVLENEAESENIFTVCLESLGGTQPDFAYTITKIDDEEYQVEGNTGEVKWLYDSDSDMLRIYGTGKMVDYANSDEANQAFGMLGETGSLKKEIKELFGDNYSSSLAPAVKTIVIDSGVTRVGDYAFYGLEMDYWGNKVYIADSVLEIGDHAFENESSKYYYFYGEAPEVDTSYTNSLGDGMKIVFLESYKEAWDSIVEKYGKEQQDSWRLYCTALYKNQFYLTSSFEDTDAALICVNPSPWVFKLFIEMLWQDIDGNQDNEKSESLTYVVEGGWLSEAIEITSADKYIYSDYVFLETKEASYTLKVYQKPGRNTNVQYDSTIHEITVDATMNESNEMTVTFMSDGKETYITGGVNAGTFTNIVGVEHEHYYEETTVLPTCTEKGYTKYICSVCDDEYTDNETAALGHQWKEVIDKVATTSATGLKHEECTVCGEKQKENTVIAKLPSTGGTTTPGGNTSGETQTPSGDVADDSQVNDGNTEQKPSTNDKEEVVYPEEGTVLTDNQLKATFSVTETGKTVAYAGTTNRKATSITIPTTVTIDGVTYTVTSIAKNVFKNNKKITKVTIGNSITSIGESAFQNCTSLKTVKMGSGVTTIGSKAFYGCKKLTSLTIGKNVTSIGTSAFQNCTSLKKVTIPSKVKKIGAKAFYGCKKLTNITIKTTKLTTKNVGKQAFTKAGSSNYKKLTVKVPKKKLKAYKTMLRKKGLSKKTKVKK